MMSGLIALIGVVVDPELAGDARAIVLHDDVRVARELHEDLLAARVLHVEPDALLVAVQHREAVALAVHLGIEAARAVAFGESLDLDDVGAHVREHQRAVGTRHDRGEIQHFHAVQWQCHDPVPLQLKVAG